MSHLVAGEQFLLLISELLDPQNILLKSLLLSFILHSNFSKSSDVSDYEGKFSSGT